MENLQDFLCLHQNVWQKERVTDSITTQVERNITAAKTRKEVGGKVELFLGQGHLTAGTKTG